MMPAMTGLNAQTPQINPQLNNPLINQPVNTNNMTWVQGEAGAKSYLVAPSGSVVLWDSEAPVIYIKTADAAGMPSMKIIDYTVRGAETGKTPLETSELNNSTRYVLKSDFDALREELEGLKEQVKHVPRQTNRPKNKGGNL